jgi:hypothetical protein
MGTDDHPETGVLIHSHSCFPIKWNVFRPSPGGIDSVPYPIPFRVVRVFRSSTKSGTDDVLVCLAELWYKSGFKEGNQT